MHRICHFYWQLAPVSMDKQVKNRGFTLDSTIAEGLTPAVNGYATSYRVHSLPLQHIKPMIKVHSCVLQDGVKVAETLAQEAWTHTISQRSISHFEAVYDLRVVEFEVISHDLVQSALDMSTPLWQGKISHGKPLTFVLPVPVPVA
eukprot:2263212-Amphidinium_carterae.1